MAVTKIHPIKSTLKKALDYIENPAKTDEKMLVSSFACSYETADIEFELLLSQAMQKGNNLAHHLIQSFAPGETTPEQAHEIGRQLADEVLQGKYPYVLTTHIDKGHVHNHIIFCAVDRRENLDIIRRILGLPKADVEDALELVGLTEFGDRLAKQCSLGMKQRLGLAGALLGRPPILILDEPTNGLDPSGIHEIRNLVKSLPSLYDCTVLISSHMLSEIELIADDIGILNHGRLLFEGSMNDLRQYALQSGFAADNLEDVFLSMVEKDNMDRKQRAKL